MSEQRTWIKNPLAVFTSNTLEARGGIVIEGAKIVELLPPASHLHNRWIIFLMPQRVFCYRA